MGAAAVLDHLGRPREVSTTAVDIPVGRWVPSDVTDIGDLVGDLDRLCPKRERGRPGDLHPLALGAVHRHVVGHLHHQRRDVGPELPLELIDRGVGILDGIVEDGRLQRGDIVDLPDCRQNRRDLDRVIDVRCLVIALASLVAMLESGERKCAKNR